DGGEPDDPGGWRLSVPRGGHRPGRQQLDQQRDRGRHRQHRAGRRDPVLCRWTLTDTGSSQSPAITQDGTFDLSLSGDTDTHGVSVAYQVSTDGITWSPTTVSQTTLADGDYRFRAVVTDPAGNSSTSNVIEVVVDNTAPVAGTLSFAAVTLTH